MPTPEFSPLELRVVRLAASPREAVGRTRTRAAIDRAFGLRRPTPLADPRLEALRAQAIRVRDGGTGVDPDFLAAGFSPDHARQVAMLVRRERPAARRDRLAHVTGITLGLGAITGFVGLTVGLLTGI